MIIIERSLMMPKRLLPYVAALISVLIATLLRVILEPAVGSELPFITFFAAALVLAWSYGFWPAALSIALSVIAGGHYILAAGTGRFWPDSRFARANMIAFTIFSLCLSFLIDVQRRTLQRARSAEREQRRANEELARMNRDLEAFAYAASHDLQEPLRTVKIFSEQLVRLYDNQGQDAEQYVGFVRQGVTRMEQLIRDLLDFSRAAHADGAPAEGTANLTISLSEALKVLGGRIEECRATIVSDPLPVVNGDQAQLAQVFQNLLSNSLKYRKTEEALRIRIVAQADRNMWVVSVADNGIGFDQEYADRIFGLFKRLHRDAYPGTGVGLAICKRVVERYGGRIWARSSSGTGATFYFALARKESQ
jgi:signal transduction histidine kinase